MEADIRLRHKCHWHYVPGSIERGEKPYPGAPYYKWIFKVECPRCGINKSVVCKTLGQAINEAEKYEVLPVFPK